MEILLHIVAGFFLSLKTKKNKKMIIKIQSINEIVEDFKSNFKDMSNFEAWSLAIQVQRNQILENGFVVSTNDSVPSALEAISIALGMTDNRGDKTVAESLYGIASKD